MTRLPLALTMILFASPAFAGWTGWQSGKWADLSSQTLEGDGVRVSNCHLERYAFGRLEAVPKCYVLNASRREATVRVEFVALDSAGGQVFAASLGWPVGLPDMTGQELSQHLAIAPEDWSRIASGKVRAWVDTSD